ncbi:adenine nucleotide alpha hydrolase family protein [Halorussus salinisoli]|uniref:hypothetical protein n=1 Tax=Halorussus salinisoli TaxID=2558242 RepID=UPI0010C19840|nr:hypothetical protein [Halorussus salinisoli]
MVDVELAVKRTISFLRERLSETGADGYVVGISGGLDSALAATLAVEAVGNEQVSGMMLLGAPSAESNMTELPTHTMNY